MSTDTVICNKQSLMPKLRKNQRLKSRWGIRYYAAVRNAIFITQAPPYVPSEPPSSLKEYISEFKTLYECPQCKDCFHFRSSLENHNTRKSLVLGYWCQQCFMTVCADQSPGGSMCSTCVRVNRDKRSYLRSRGLHKNQKFGAIRVFYNQCQFFAHLKTHNVNNVDMGDLMLMPLPTNLDHNWSSEIDIAYEALMEHAFIIKVHIMDWLKQRNMENNWWQLVSGQMENDYNPVSLIIQGYKGRFYFKPLEIPVEEQFSILNSPHPILNKESTNVSAGSIDTAEKIDKRKTVSSGDTTATVSDENVTENEDNPCTVTDIAFVDCGPTSKFFEPEVPLKNTSKRAAMSVNTSQDFSAASQPANLVNKTKKLKAAHLNCTSSDIVMSYGNTVITPKPDTAKQPWKTASQKSGKAASPIKVVNESNVVKVDPDANVHETSPEIPLSVEPLSVLQSDTSSTAPEANVSKDKVDKSKQNVHTLTVNSGRKMVTLQGTKHIDTNMLINQLSPRIVNSKKYVVIGRESDNVAARTKEELSPKKLVQIVPDVKGVKTVQNKVLHATSELADKDSTKTIPKTQSDSPKSRSRPCTGKVLYQNGRKYIIKQTSNSNKNVKNASKATKEVQRTCQSKSTNSIPPLIPLNSMDLDNIQIQERMNSVQRDTSPLTPSPSPSELSSSSSCDVQSKQFSSSAKVAQKMLEVSHLGLERAGDNAKANGKNKFESLSFHKGDDENLYLDVKFLNLKPVYTLIDTTAMITRCKQEMLNEFFHLSYADLKKRYDHLQLIREEVLKAMSFVGDNAIKENLKSVNILQHVLKHCVDKCSKTVDNENDEDTPLCEWESRYEAVEEKLICTTCSRIAKPEWYIPGFSKPTANNLYCSCYRHVCHKCDMYQGNWTRFAAHQTLHNKRKPYLCPDCFRQFTSYKSLEIHTWTSCFNTLKKRILGCKICEIDGFQDMESIARHFAIMHTRNKIACDKCYMVLPSYSEYKKHHKEKHSNSDDQHPIRLVLCKLGRCIVRCEEFMLHMEKHLVVQRLILFKCPFCNFTDIKPKRTLSHMQSEHLPRLNELMCPEVLRKLSTSELGTNPPTMHQKKFTNAHEEPCEDGTIVPKIVNARTITSEVFERGAQEADDYLPNTDVSDSRKTENAKKTMPQILDVRSIALSDLAIMKSKHASKTASNGETVNNGEQEETGKEADSPRQVTAKGNARKCQSGSNVDEVAEEKLKGHDEPTNESTSDIANEKLPFEEENVDGTEAKETENGRNDSPEQLENSHRHSISKPPPLIRIPQHFYQSNGLEKVYQPARERKEKSTARNRETMNREPRRIALNGPLNSPEAALNFACHLCGELINTSLSRVTDHFETKHSKECKLSTVALKLLRISQEFIDGGYRDLLARKKRKLENGAPSSKRRRRWTPKKYNESKNSNFTGLGLCVQQETAEDSEGNFRCKKCGQRCTDMTDLREHIATNHRIRGRYLICLECGENFVVAPSLQMHLKAFHGIEDPITYMAQNTLYAPDSVDDLELEGKAIEANQCHVCMAVFEHKAAVDKHLRVHGMAFLNRKRIEAQNALRSPEKKNENEEEKTVETSPKEAVRKDKPAETILEKITATI